MRKILKQMHRIAADTGLCKYRLEEITEKFKPKEVIITLKRYRDDFDRERERNVIFQPVALVGKRVLKIGEGICWDLNCTEGAPGPASLRHDVHRELFSDIEKKLRGYVSELRVQGVNAVYKDFERSY